MDPAYRSFVLAEGLSSLVSGTFRAALPLWALSQGTSIGRAAALAALAWFAPGAVTSLFGGWAADKFGKRAVLVLGRGFELFATIVLVGILAVGGIHSNVLPAMILTLGLIHWFFVPSRYGILPEVLDDRGLTYGSGVLEFSRHLGACVGVVIASGMVGSSQSGLVLLFPLGAASAALFLTLLLDPTTAMSPNRSVLASASAGALRRLWDRFGTHRGLRPTMLGLCLAAGMNVLFWLNAWTLGAETLGLSESPEKLTALVALLLGGTAVGGWLAGRLSVGAIEIGLIPLASIIWFIAAIGLCVVRSPFPAAALLIIGGAAGGAVSVPLLAFLEKHFPGKERGAGMALAQLFASLSAVLAVIGWLVFEPLLGSRLTFLVAGAVLLGVSALLIKRMPEFFVRFIVFLVTRLVYRIRLVGFENVPMDGPALLVFNHTSFADGNIITASIPRILRFLVYRGHYENPILKWLGDTFQAIPVDSDAPPKEIVRQLRAASDALQRGELLCIFAEGSISRTGFLLPFQRGFEMIMKRAPGVPIVPAYIDGMWGSIFSYDRGKFFWKWPKGLTRQVTIKFGAPLPSDTPAFKVREAVQLLGVDCCELRKYTRLPLHRQFIYTAKKYARRPAMTDPMTPMITYGRALMGSAIFTRLLKPRLGPEQCVGLFVPPSVGAALANVAVSMLGKIPVNLNYTVGNETLNACIRQAGIKQVITSRRFLDKLAERGDAEPLVPEGELIFLEDVRATVGLKEKLFGLMVRLLPAWITDHWVLGLGRHGMDDLASIIFSSGSTGEPKGVMLTQHNVMANIESVSQMVNATEQDGVLAILPIFHSFGFTVTFWLPLMIGARIAFHVSPLEAEAIGKMCREHKLTIVVATATFLRGYIRRCDKEDFAHLRLLVCGAEKLPMQVADQFEHKFGLRPLEGYGCTELSPAATANVPDVVFGNYTQIGNKRGTIGHPFPGQAARIVDPDTWEPLPIGQEGMILIKGPNVMKGYLHKPELTAQVVRDGWYRTGDIGKMDEDGFVTITDRDSRFSKIAGEMVPHGKIEDVIHEILDTHDRLCAVVGVPDLRKGERLVVIHTTLPMPVDQLWEAMRDRGLPPLWVPARNVFFEVPELPILGTGKLDLRGVKKIAHEKMAKEKG